MKRSYYYTLFLLTLPILCGCGGKNNDAPVASQESRIDTAAMRRLQGIWVDEETEAPLFRVMGDSIFYPDTTSLPVDFDIKADTLRLGKECYLIEKQSDYHFSFHSMTGEVIQVKKSAQPEDSLLFETRRMSPIIYNEVTKRDTVCNYSGERYHCYVTVNPTRKKVYKTSYTDEGVAVQNFYYDNVIHVSVYHGNSEVYHSNFQKEKFSDLIPERFLQQATLSDIKFSHVDKVGCHFYATICIPDGAACYMVDVTISFTGDVDLQLLDY